MNCYDLRLVQLFGTLVDLYAAQIGKAVAFIRKSLSLPYFRRRRLEVYRFYPNFKYWIKIASITNGRYSSRSRDADSHNNGPTSVR